MNEPVVPFRPSGTVKCASCGSKNVSTEIEEQQFDWGVGEDAQTLSARVPVHTCRDCGFVFTDEFAEAARHNVVCRHLGVLSPSQIRSMRERYALTRAEFARITEIGEASLARWESGALLQNKALDHYLRLVAIPENLARLQHHRISSEARSAEPQFKVINIAERRQYAATFRLRPAVGH